jgi:asparagine synthetase B (glutamine-hydrolysing)
MHASGIALVDDEGVYVHKAPIQAWKFLESDDCNEFLLEHLTDDTKIALLHTRWATQGNPEVNENNHPVFDGETAVVHNGMIQNDSWLFSQNKDMYERSCETDSDVIRAIVSAHGFHEKGLRELNKLSGSAAIACVSAKFPDELLLARSGSPLCYGFTEDNNKMYWASEVQAILKAGQQQYKEVRGTFVHPARVPMSVGSMPDNTAWLFNGEQMILHHEFKACSTYRAPDYSRGRVTYWQKRKEWKRQRKFIKQSEKNPQDVKLAPITNFGVHVGGGVTPGTRIQCPGCKRWLKNLTGRPWKECICPEEKCGSSLG